MRSGTIFTRLKTVLFIVTRKATEIETDWYSTQCEFKVGTGVPQHNYKLHRNPKKYVIVSLFFKCAILKQRLFPSKYIKYFEFVTNVWLLYNNNIWSINRYTLGNSYQEFFMIICNTIFYFGH